MACGASTVGTDDVAGGSAGELPSKTAGSSGRTGGTSGRDQSGRGGQIGLGGGGSAGEGGGGQVSPDGGFGGYVPSVDYCGGCAPNWYVVKCSWGDVPLGGATSDDEGYYNAENACAAAVRNSGHANGGQGGVSEVSPGSCETYVAPERVEFDDGGCIGVEQTRRAGECHVGGECCVVVERISCGV